MGKRKSIQQALLGNLNSSMQSNETRTHPHTMHKNIPNVDVRECFAYVFF